MLLLVLTDGHQVSVVEKDVGGHQHRIVQQAHGDVVPLLHRFLLELNHPLQPVERRDAIQQPAQFAVGCHLALHKHRTAFGVHATGQVERCCGTGVLSQAAGVMGNGDGVEIHDTDKGVVGLLQINPIADGTQPIAEVQCSGRLHPGKNPWPAHQSGLGCFCFGVVAGGCF